jgi:hypothetical protein
MILSVLPIFVSLLQCCFIRFPITVDSIRNLFSIVRFLFTAFIPLSVYIIHIYKRLTSILYARSPVWVIDARVNSSLKPQIFTKFNGWLFKYHTFWAQISKFHLDTFQQIQQLTRVKL